MMTHESHPVQLAARVAYRRSTVRMTEAALPTGASVDADMSTRMTKTELEGTDNRQRKKNSLTTQGSKKQGEYFALIRL
jgi:hypothetical protein